MIILTNRASVYIELHRYQNAIEDAARAIEIDPTWIKGYYRMAAAYRETSNFHEALEFISRGLAIKPDFEELVTLQKGIEADLAIETALPLDHPERQKFNNLVN